MTKLVALPLDAAPTLDDLLYMINAPGTVPVDRRVPLGDTAAPLAAAPAFTSGYVAQGSQLISAKDAAYGAVGNGSADDTAALTNALAAAAGGVLLLPPGNYKITSALTIPADTILFGPGAQITVPAASVVGAFIMSARSWLVDVTIEGSGAKASDRFAVYGTALPDVRVDGVTVQNWHGVGVRLRSCARPHVIKVKVDTVTRTSGDYGAGIQLTYDGTATDTTDGVVDDCHVNDCAGSGIQLDGDWNRLDWRTAGAKARNCSVTNSTARDCTFAGIFVNSGFDCVVDSCHGEDNGDYGIGFEFCKGSSINGSTATGNGNNGLSIYNTNENCSINGGAANGNTGDGVQVLWNSGTIPGDTPSTDIHINGVDIFGNTVNGVRFQSVLRCSLNSSHVILNPAGVYTTACTDITVNGGIVAGSTGIGIRFINTKQPHVVAARILFNGQIGVRLEGSVGATTEDALISACVIRANTQVGVEIPLATYVTDTLITGCEIIDNLTYGVSAVSGVVGLRIVASRVEGNVSGQILAPGVIGLFVSLDGAGSPEGVLYGGPGSTWLRNNGAEASTLYVKETGVGTLYGWVRYAGVGSSVAVRHGSGRYYTTPASTLTTGTHATNQMRAVPISVPKVGTFDRIGLEVTAAGAAGTLIRLGIYEDDGTGVPGTLVADLGTVAGDAIATPELTISQAITPGIYWLVAVAQLGIPTTRVVTGMSALLGYAAAPTSNHNAAVQSATTVSGALPGTFGTPTFRGDGPRVFVRTV